ncbi:hypothetical protein SDC9_173485 [bioreactor metagenome]|uniref:Uncharacterized protein n=1 Tax=bioreactor metagenome TaxID=1076179 RepID=A0A645GQV9_9ZZZZ
MDGNVFERILKLSGSQFHVDVHDLRIFSGQPQSRGGGDAPSRRQLETDGGGRFRRHHPAEPERQLFGDARSESGAVVEIHGESGERQFERQFIRRLVPDPFLNRPVVGEAFERGGGKRGRPGR